MMRELPTVSVIMPAFNGEKYIASAIGSALKQLGARDEILVVDNASTDATADIVRNMKDPRIRYFLEPKKGAAAARNRAFRQMKGELVAFLDSDDLWPEGRQTGLAEVLENDPSVDAAYGRLRMFLDGAVDSRISQMDGALSPDISLCPFLFRRTVLDKCGDMDESMLVGEDTDYLARLRESGMQAKPWSGDAYIYRRHGANTTALPESVGRGLLGMLARKISRGRAQASDVTDREA